jgi:phage gpG-like protein
VTDDGRGVQTGANHFSGEWNGGAAVHQSGSANGNIPARPFPGFPKNNREMILREIEEYLLG